MWRKGRERILIKGKKRMKALGERDIDFDKGEITCNGLGQVAKKGERKRELQKKGESMLWPETICNREVKERE